MYENFFWTLVKGLASTGAYSMIGLLVFALAFWLMDKCSPFSLRKEIEEDENTALAMIMSAVVIGISLIIMGALLG